MAIEQTLYALSADGVYPFHMPGHKRNPAFAFCEHPVSLDTTEVTGADDLHDPHGMLAETMALAARLTGSRQSYLLINGSTAGLLAGITAATHRGDTVLVARNCHRSVAHALALAGVNPIWLSPTWNAALGTYEQLSPETVRQALLAHPEATLTVMTSPTYEGVVSEIGAIAETVHAAGGTLLVDEAHGAHFGYSPLFPKSAVTLGADIVVQSLHKTLPSPTQTALLHVCSDRVDSDRVQRQLSIFQTSSPSYLLMAGIDTCLRLLEAHGTELFAAYEQRLTLFRRTAAPWLLPANGDPGKLILPCENGAQLARDLREQFGLETEMHGAHHVLAMTSVADTDEGFERLATALAALRPTPSADSIACPPLPTVAVSPATAYNSESERVPLAEAAGRVAAEELYCYPPGIPLTVAGERLTDELVCYIAKQQAAGVHIRGAENETVKVLLK